jgi:heptosyltransferase-2
MEFPLLSEEREWALELPRATRGPLVAIYPGSGGYSLARRWGWENYIAVGRALEREFDAQIVVVGGPQETELAWRVAAGIPNALNLAGETTLGQLGALLGRCQLFVGNDGGPMHLAATMGVPVVAIFGPSNHRAWGPYAPSGRARIVRVDLPCSPCLYVGHRLGRRHGCATMECLRLVTPDMVLGPARELLSGT